MNPLAEQLNQTLKASAPHVYDMLSDVGKKLFFPKGILSQSAEAKEKAHAINATIGIAKEGGQTMHFDTVMPTRPRRASASLPVMPIGRRSTTKQWLSESCSVAGSHGGAWTCGSQNAHTRFIATPPVLLPEISSRFGQKSGWSPLMR